MAIALRGARLTLAARSTLVAHSPLAARSTLRGAARRLCSTASSAPVAPTRTQLVRLGIAAGVPFVGFGIADNGIMILAGDYIDGTLGVKFGLSTMAAAGIGNLISDVVGVSMGEVIESFCATRLGLRAPALTEAQLDLRVVRTLKAGSCMLGVAIGCVIGMAPLLWMDNKKAVYFSDDEAHLYQTSFAPYGVSPTSFFELLKCGTWRDGKEGERVVSSGLPLDRVLLLHTGRAEALGPESFFSPQQRERRGHYEAPPEAGAPHPHDEDNRGCIIGGSALVDPSVLGAKYPSDVVLTKPSQYIEWRTAELKAAMSDDKSVESAVLGILYRELVERRKADKAANRRRNSAAPDSASVAAAAAANAGSEAVYLQMMKVVVADGLVHPNEKAMLAEFAAAQHVTPAAHRAALGACGWTEAEFDHGVRQSVMLLRQNSSATDAVVGEEPAG